MLSKHIITLFLVLNVNFVIGQNVNFEWVKTIQGKKQDEVYGNQIATDSKGNVYTVGVFKNSVNFAAPAGSYLLSVNRDTSKFGKVNTEDLFIVKHNSVGKFIWAKAIGGPNTEYISSITIDATDNIILGGIFDEKTDFDPNGGQYFLSPEINGNTFILKLDTGGAFIWAKSIMSSVGIGLEIDNENNIVGMGYNSGKVDINPGADSFIIKKNGVFTFKLNNNGDFIWGKHFEGNSILYSNFAIDSVGNIYSCGTLGYSKTDFDPGPDSFIMKTTFGYKVYITKLDRSGNFAWAKSVGGQADQYSYTRPDIDVDQNGNVYVTGYFESTCDFDPGSNIYNLEGKPHDNPYEAVKFILKLNTNGNFEWVRKIDPGHVVYSMPIKCDKRGGIYIGGNFAGTVDFDPGLGINNMVSTQGYEKISGNYFSKDGFILKLNKWGNFVWSKKIGGPDFDLINRLAVNKKGEIVCFGIFSDTLSYFWKNRDSINFNPGGVNGRLYGCGNFILKYSQTICSNLTLTVDTVKQVSCTAGPGYISTKTVGGKLPYTYLWNTTPAVKKPNNTFNSRGQYTITVTDSLGCKNASTIVLDGPLFKNGFDVASYLSAGTFRPGVKSRVVLTALNEGCTILNGYLKLKLDTQLTYISATPAPDTIKNNFYTWKSSLISSDTKPFVVELTVMPKTYLNVGDSVDLDIAISPLKDANPLNNSKSYRFRIVNSYDPNNKLVYPAGACKKRYVLKNKPLTYTINFQNTGTAEAINVNVIDTISYNLNINSLRVIAQSHPGLITEIINNKWVRFKFDNINLPDSNSNEKASHGYIIYEIYPDSAASNENTVTGNAGIFFDFNEPVFTNYITNTLTNVIPVCPARVGIKNPTKLQTNTLFPNPTDGVFYILLNDKSFVNIYTIQGNILRSETHEKGVSTIDISYFKSGIYIIETNQQRFRLVKFD